MIYTVTLNPALDRELAVPEIVGNKVLRATHSQVDFGGKGFNVSRMIASLGGESVAVGFVGGKCGEMLQDGLITSGIRTEFVWLSEETRTNVSIVANGHYIKVNEAGSTIDQGAFKTLLNKIQGLAKAGDWWILAGSLPPGVPIDGYAQITAVLKKKKAVVILDSSGTPMIKGCAAKPHWIKPNQTELQQITGQVDPLKGIQTLHKAGIKNIALTLGDKGAYLATGADIWRGFSPEIVESNPIGAGDSFLAGLIWALSRQETRLDAFRWGLACGSATAEQPGTTVGSLQRATQLREEVFTEELFDLEKITQIM